jgi:hypothetical protein
MDSFPKAFDNRFSAVIFPLEEVMKAVCWGDVQAESPSAWHP